MYIEVLRHLLGRGFLRAWTTTANGIVLLGVVLPMMQSCTSATGERETLDAVGDTGVWSTPSTVSPWSDAVVIQTFAASTTGIAQCFRAPVAGYHGGDGCLDFLDRNPFYANHRHAGDDFCAPVGTEVRAVAAGRVVFAGPHGTCPNWGTLIVVEHTLPDGSKVVSIYGHVAPDPGLLGSNVALGQRLGEVAHLLDASGASCWADHVHMAIAARGWGAALGAYPSWLAGYLADSAPVAPWEDPVTFLASHADCPPTVGSPTYKRSGTHRTVAARYDDDDGRDPSKATMTYEYTDPNGGARHRKTATFRRTSGSAGAGTYSVSADVYGDGFQFYTEWEDHGGHRVRVPATGWTTTPKTTFPLVTSFAVNEGLPGTTGVWARATFTSSGSVTSFRVSESPTFSGAKWRSPAVSGALFRLGTTPGQRPFYFQTRNSTGDSAVVSDSITVVPAGEFTGDLSAELTWTRNVGVLQTVWQMSGTALQASIDLPAINLGTEVLVVGDVDGDGRADEVIADRTHDRVAVWAMAGTTLRDWWDLGPLAPGWDAAAVSDVNMDGWNDVVLHEPTQGRVAVWFLVGGHFVDTADLDPYNPAAELVGMADFYGGDGAPDELFQEAGGNIWVHGLYGVTTISNVFVTAALPEERVVAITDADKDGDPDLIIRNILTSGLEAWLLQNLTVVDRRTIATATAMDWSIVGP